jgi:uncharacterized protein (DUF983 family)
MDDGWELLMPDEIHRLTCQFCRAQFNGLTVECGACASDEFITSVEAIDPAKTVCSSCGHSNHSANADDDEASCI